jgi:hypothetical protein
MQFSRDLLPKNGPFLGPFLMVWPALSSGPQKILESWNFGSLFPHHLVFCPGRTRVDLVLRWLSKSGEPLFSSSRAMTVWLLGVGVAAFWPSQLVKNLGDFSTHPPPAGTHSPGEVPSSSSDSILALLCWLFLPAITPWAESTWSDSPPGCFISLSVFTLPTAWHPHLEQLHRAARPSGAIVCFSYGSCLLLRRQPTLARPGDDSELDGKKRTSVP